MVKCEKEKNGDKDCPGFEVRFCCEARSENTFEKAPENIRPYMNNMKVWNGEADVADYKLIDSNGNDLDKPTGIFKIGSDSWSSQQEDGTVVIEFKVIGVSVTMNESQAAQLL